MSQDRMYFVCTNPDCWEASGKDVYLARQSAGTLSWDVEASVDKLKAFFARHEICGITGRPFRIKYEGE